MRKLIALAAAGIAALALAVGASAGIVAENDVTVGDNDTAALTLNIPAGLTTAYGFQAWSSVQEATVLEVAWNINCTNPANDASGSTILPMGVTSTGSISPVIQFFTASRDVAEPWFGWDHCFGQVFVTQVGGQGADHSLAAWVNSHNGG